MKAERYRKLSAWFAARPRAFRLLALLNRFLPALSYVLYPLLLLWLAVRRDSRLGRVLAVPLAGFLLCTLIRHAVRAKRPYEWGIEPLIRRKKTGDSFPSRHVTCASAIAMAYGYVCPPLGIVLGFAAAGIALIRVAAGIHFPRDVLAGGALGVLCGVAGFWL